MKIFKRITIVLLMLWLIMLTFGMYQSRQINMLDKLARPGAAITTVQEIYGSVEPRKARPDDRWLVPAEAQSLHKYGYGGAFCYIYVSGDGYVVKTYWYFT